MLTCGAFTSAADMLRDVAMSSGMSHDMACSSLQGGSLVSSTGAKQSSGLFGGTKKHAPAAVLEPAAAATVHLTPVVRVN